MKCHHSPCWKCHVEGNLGLSKITVVLAQTGSGVVQAYPLSSRLHWKQRIDKQEQVPGLSTRLMRGLSRMMFMAQRRGLGMFSLEKDTGAM